MSIERLIWSPPSCAVFTEGDVLVQVWEREAPASAFRTILAHLEERARVTPGRPLWMIAISSERAPMPDAAARATAARFPEFFTEFALVIEGTGFRASASRGVMASMSMMATRRNRPHITSNVHDACVRIATASAGAVDPSALVRTIGETRDALRRDAPELATR